MASYLDGAPDVGTIGGTMQDADGENSATLGGISTPDQQWANNDVDWQNYFDPSIYSLGSPSTGVYGNPLSPNTTPFGQFTSSLEDFFTNNRFGKLANFAMNLTPVGRAINVGRGVLGSLNNNNYLGAGAQVLGAYGGLPGVMVNSAYQASRGNMSPMAGLAGGMVGGPLAGQAASTLVGMAPRAAPTETQENGFNMQGLVEGLGSLYGLYQGNRDASEASKLLTSGTAGTDLNSMFGPDSAWGQQMRQSIERRDAAAGRRSQYGPRERELAATGADMMAKYGSQMANANTNSARALFEMNQAKSKQRQQNLNQLFLLAKNSGLFGKTATPPFNPNAGPIMGNTSLESIWNDMPTATSMTNSGSSNNWWEI